MGIASQMKELTREIASSHRARTRKLGEIRRETKQIRGEAHHLIEGFHTSRRHEATELKRDLARGETERKSDSQKMLTGFQSSRKEDSSQMREGLSRDHAARKSEVSKMLRDSQSSRKEDSSQVRVQLAQGLAERKSELSKMQGDIQKAQAEVRADLKEAKAAWQGLGGTIQVNKGRTETPLVAATSAAEKRNSDLEIKMLTAVREHPEGMTLAGMAGSLGVAAVVLGRLSKSLMKKGMIHKVEKLYFPANGGSDTKQGLHFKPPLR
jgi:YesN/AraC family two-component response regulator